MQFTYGIATSTEVAYYTYIYAKVPKAYYQKVTSFTRVAILLGRFVSGISSQILVSGSRPKNRNWSRISSLLNQSRSTDLSSRDWKKIHPFPLQVWKIQPNLEASLFRSIPLFVASIADLILITLFNFFIEQPFVKRMYINKTENPCSLQTEEKIDIKDTNDKLEE